MENLKKPRSDNAVFEKVCDSGVNYLDIFAPISAEVEAGLALRTGREKGARNETHWTGWSVARETDRDGKSQGGTKLGRHETRRNETVTTRRQVRRDETGTARDKAGRNRKRWEEKKPTTTRRKRRKETGRGEMKRNETIQFRTVGPRKCEKVAAGK